VRNLVSELGFTTLAMEAGASDIELLNDYVLHGTGDLDSALTAQGYIGWDTEELAAMFAWMRAYNSGVSARRRVQVVGLDILMHARGRARVLEYLQTHAPARLAETTTLFETLAEEEANLGSTRLRQERVAASQVPLEALRDFLLAHTGNGADARHAARDVARMIQRAQFARPPEVPGHVSRSVAMGRNLVELLEERAGSKVIVWAHNVHVTDRDKEGQANLGSELRVRLGEAYYAMGFEFGRGVVRVRPRTTQGTLGPLRELDVASAPPMSLPGYLARAGTGTMFVDLRASRPPSVSAWLARPLETHFIAWNHQASQPQRVRETIGRYDGIVYVPVSSPARPTRNAVEKAARGQPL
jgi:erythromycin esterase